MENNEVPMDSDSRVDAARADDAARVERLRGGDETAFGELYDAWFDRVHDLAFRIVGDAGADVAQDTFLAAWRSIDSLENPNAFGGWLLRIARNRSLNRLDREQRAHPVDDVGLEMIESSGPSAANAPAGFRVEDRLGAVEDPARAIEDAETVDLVWEAADALGERDATVLGLTLRHGLTPAEIGEVVGVNRNAANQLVHRVRNRLGDAVRARVLWRGGAPVCDELAAALDAAGVERFGPDAVRVTGIHAEGCEVCEERRRLALAPSALFAAIPLMGAPALLKTEIAAALTRDGVPMQGSAVGEAARAPEGDEGELPPASDADAFDGGGGAGGWRSWQKVAAVAAAAALMIVGSAAWLLARDGGGGSAVTTGDAVTTTTGAVSTTTTSTSVTSTTSTTTPSGVAPPAEEPPDAPPVTDDPPPAPPPPSDPPGALGPTIEVTITPEEIGRGEPWPVLSWDVSIAGGATVKVTGPGMPPSYAASGQRAVCPSLASGSTCDADAGRHPYTVVVFDAIGTTLTEQSVVLTVSDTGPGPP